MLINYQQKFIFTLFLSGSFIVYFLTFLLLVFISYPLLFSNKIIIIMNCKEPSYPDQIAHSLYLRYSSSQSYYYTKKINDVVKEKRTENNIRYQDIECFCDGEEYLKRIYELHENERKIFAFKEYYFYHEDCPRIFCKHLELMYEKWQDKRRDLVYKKLKVLYNEPYSSLSSSEETVKEDGPPISNFLLNISEFNPYSKKYYLRVQARRDKEQEQKKKEAQLKKTKIQLSSLNHNLSHMLADIQELSIISTLHEAQTFQTEDLRTSGKNKLRSSLSKNQKSSLNKLNFKKNKQYTIEQSYKKNLYLNDPKKGLRIPENKRAVSPKMESSYKKIEGLNMVKAKSIFSISSLPLNKNSLPDVQTQPQQNSYRSTKQKSTQLISTQTLNHEIQRVNKNNKTAEKKKSTLTNRQPLLTNFKQRQSSLKELNYQKNEFSDNKIQSKKLSVDKLRASGGISQGKSMNLLNIELKKNVYKTRSISRK